MDGELLLYPFLEPILRPEGLVLDLLIELLVGLLDQDCTIQPLILPLHAQRLPHVEKELLGLAISQVLQGLVQND